jgi:hypothetical protein
LTSEATTLQVADSFRVDERMFAGAFPGRNASVGGERSVARLTAQIGMKTVFCKLCTIAPRFYPVFQGPMAACPAF